MRRLALLPALLLVASCGEGTTEPAMESGVTSLAEKSSPITPLTVPNVVDDLNALLSAQGSEYQVEYVEYLTDQPGADEANIIIASDRGNKRLAFDFIPDDPRRGGADGDPNTIDFWIDQTQGATASGLSETETTAAISSAMSTWDARQCSALNANLVPVQADLGLVQFILGFGGGPAVSDIMHAGWLPAAFFDAIRPNGSASILGVAFTLTFTAGDLDGDGNPDLAAREIYYNDRFAWRTDGTPGFADVETVALHEAGHGLSQAHFGKVFLDNNGSLNFAPRAVMNAVYTGVNRDLGGTDDSGHCGLWGSWPQN